MIDELAVLVIEDEAEIRLLLRRALEREGYHVDEAASATEARKALRRRVPKLVLLDLGLPDADGLELMPMLKAAGAGVVVVSARDATEEKVAALDLGADDYVTKPFDTEEILARIRRALRHRTAGGGDGIVTCGELLVDLGARRVAMRGQYVHLAPKEYAVLAELARHAGKVLTHAQLLRSVWGPAHAGDIEYLRVTIRSIRRKLGEEPQTSIIRNEPAVGYRMIA
ncbi:MAG TPA: response regulator transcription factor [Novosphingobium sp.]|nr:response regulator transcription factor [Novosphingobium sp.]